jgi:hypothetical protein
MSELCSRLSLAADEPLAATATTAEQWLLLEVPGAWPRDVDDDGPLPPVARTAVDAWAGAGELRRIQFIRRLGRSTGRLLAFVGTARERRAALRRIELTRHEELAELDLDGAGEPVDGSLVLVCGHGSRDRCCALLGTPVYTALAEHLGEDEVWLSSHQAGHRFAANVLVLPLGLQFGRVSPDDAPLVVERALAGRIDLDRYRGRTCYAGSVQAAEAAVRRKAAIESVEDVALKAVENGLVRFRTADGDEYAVEVEEVEGPAVPPSCGEPARAQRHFRAVSLARV